MTNSEIKIGIVQINVTDLDEAWRFYVEILELQGKRKLGPGQPFELELGSNGPTVLVDQVRQQTKRNYPREIGVTLVFLTNDIRSTVVNWKAKGVSFIPVEQANDESGIADTPIGSFIAFRDPCGNVHKLLEPLRTQQAGSTDKKEDRSGTLGASRFPLLKDVFDGFPQTLVPQRTFQMLVKYTLMLDTLGRIDAETGEPLVDEHTLQVLLADFVGDALAERLVALVVNLPACAFRPAHEVGRPVIEIPFFGLAKEVAIFDPTPTNTFRELIIPQKPQVFDIVVAVRTRFPSFEDELLKPDQIPPRLEALLKDDSSLDAVLRSIFRQLGWWAALTAVLLIPLMAMLRTNTEGKEDLELQVNAWPLSMYLLGTIIGGWTLTVAGSFILAPVDVQYSYANT